MTEQNFSMYAGTPEIQQLTVNFDDQGVCDWRTRIAENGYLPQDRHHSVVLMAIGLDLPLGEDDAPFAVPGTPEQKEMLNNFEMDIDLGKYGRYSIVNNEHALGVNMGEGAYRPHWAVIGVTTQTYLGESKDLDCDEHEDTLNEITELRNFVQALDKPVFVEKVEPIQYLAHEESPWLGLFNEAVHKVKALREELGVDVIEYDGAAPWVLVEFFKQAQKETPEWFYTLQEERGHIALWADYDAARRFCMTAIGNKEKSTWRDAHIAIYQMLALSTKDILNHAREPFFKHIRDVARRHGKVFARTPSLSILKEAYYDFDYLNIFFSSRNGTLQYIQYLEMKARALLEQKLSQEA